MLTWNPDNCGARNHGANLTYHKISRCECGRTGYAHGEDHSTEDEPDRDAPDGADETDGEDIEACTCGRPVCDDCYQGECPHQGG